MTKVDELLAEVDDILRGVDADLTDRGDLLVTQIANEPNGNLIANIKSGNGYSVIYPHPESQSMLVAKPVYFKLISDGPRILRALVDLVENRENQVKSAKNQAESA